MWKEGPRKANNGEYEAEKEFYFSFVLTVIDYVLLFLTLRLLMRFVSQQSIRKKSLTVHLIKAITLANIAKFFMIPIVIWGNNNSTGVVPSEAVSLRLVIVNCYYFLSLVHVIAVLVNCSRKLAAIITLVLLAFKYMVMVEVSQRLKHFVVI